jgi:hypothetical protein
VQYFRAFGGFLLCRTLSPLLISRATNSRAWLEAQSWPEGPVCSHCGTVNHAYKTKKPGWYRCAEKDCRKDFTVMTGTVMEGSYIALQQVADGVLPHGLQQEGRFGPPAPARA